MSGVSCDTELVVSGVSCDTELVVSGVSCDTEWTDHQAWTYGPGQAA